MANKTQKSSKQIPQRKLPVGENGFGKRERPLKRAKCKAPSDEHVFDQDCDHWKADGMLQTEVISKHHLPFALNSGNFITTVQINWNCERKLRESFVPKSKQNFTTSAWRSLHEKIQSLICVKSCVSRKCLTTNLSGPMKKLVLLFDQCERRKLCKRMYIMYLSWWNRAATRSHDYCCCVRGCPRSGLASDSRNASRCRLEGPTDRDHRGTRRGLRGTAGSAAGRAGVAPARGLRAAAAVVEAAGRTLRSPGSGSGSRDVLLHPGWVPLTNPGGGSKNGHWKISYNDSFKCLWLEWNNMHKLPSALCNIKLRSVTQNELY